MANLTHEQEMLETKFKKQNAVIFDLLKKTSCQNTEQLKDKTRSYAEMARASQNLREDQSRLLGDKSLGRLAARATSLNRLSQRVGVKDKGRPRDVYGYLYSSRRDENDPARDRRATNFETQRNG